MATKRDELARVDLDVHVIEGGLVGLRRIHLGDVLEQDHRVDPRLARLLLARGLDRCEERGEVGAGERGVQIGDLGALIGRDLRGDRRGGRERIGHGGASGEAAVGTTGTTGGTAADGWATPCPEAGTPALARKAPVSPGATANGSACGANGSAGAPGAGCWAN